MTQALDIRLEGESITVTSAELLTVFDTPDDSFSAEFLVNRIKQPKLYKRIRPYRGTPAEVYIDGKLKLTGNLTRPTRKKTSTGVTTRIKGYSGTFNFIDSKLKPPYQLEKKSIHSLCIIAGRQTGTRIIHPTKFDTAEGTAPFDRATIRPGQSGYDFCAPLAAQRQHVISNTIEGDILLQQADTDQASIGTINEDSTLIQKEFEGSWDLRERFKTLTVKSQTPKGSGQATATDDNINFPRHNLVSAYEQVKGGLAETAKWNLTSAIVEELTQEIPLVGWNAPNGELWEPGKIITLISETLFVPNGFDYFIRAVKFILNGSTKTSVISLIPPGVYTNEPIQEPWFDLTQRFRFQPR